jgi:hypothetical protein
MNAEVDEAAEERKGGAGHLGKMLLSAGDKQVAIVCHVPKALQVCAGEGSWQHSRSRSIQLGHGSCLAAAEVGWHRQQHHKQQGAYKAAGHSFEWYRWGSLRRKLAAAPMT